MGGGMNDCFFDVVKAEHRRLEHLELEDPENGELKLDYASFQSNDDPALKLVICAVA